MGPTQILGREIRSNTSHSRADQTGLCGKGFLPIAKASNRNNQEQKQARPDANLWERHGDKTRTTWQV
jgi:hypothetical protein